MNRFVCAIESIDYLNHDTRRVILSLPDGSARLGFKAGQYLNVVLAEKRCPFSIASPPELKGKVELHIKPTPGSDDSIEIEKLLDEATTLEIELPIGDCYVEQAPKGTLILMAASTGITQMKSIIEHLAADVISEPTYLYWGVIADSDLYLAQLCREWEQVNKNFHFIPVVSEPNTSPDWQGRTGLVPDAVPIPLVFADLVRVLRKQRETGTTEIDLAVTISIAIGQIDQAQVHTIVGH
ncbi:MAG: NAD(P)H-flavin reductase [Gammaproteobacteria bacterium]|nr:NAD(P)H-flavin reductase [Gammaproteobacteria bacterium]